MLLYTRETHRNEFLEVPSRFLSESLRQAIAAAIAAEGGPARVADRAEASGHLQLITQLTNGAVWNLTKADEITALDRLLGFLKLKQS